MHKKVRGIFFGAVLLTALSLSAAGQAYIIRSRLFVGRHNLDVTSPSIVISTENRIPDLRREGSMPSEVDEIAYYRGQLRSVYQLSSVDFLASSRLLWDGRRKTLQSTIILDTDHCPIQFTPKRMDRNKISLRVEIFKLKPREADVQDPSRPPLTVALKEADSRSPTDRETLLDTEIVMELDDSVVLGFPSEGKKFFLTVDIARNRPRTISDRPLGAGIKEVNLLQAPKSIHQVNPAYPEECRRQEIEGLVVLQVSMDKKGNVSNLKVLKKVHPLLDKAALDAIGQWKFEPVLLNGKPVPVIFNMTVNFRLPNEESL